MNRRNFLRLAGGAVLLPSGFPLLARADAASDPWLTAFQQAESASPWTLAYRSASADVAGEAIKIRGRFPAAVHGVLFRNGPAVHELGGLRYHHWFDGDGMIQRFVIGATRVAHTGKIVRTPKYEAEMAAGKRLVEGFGTLPPNVQPTASPETLNTANTSVLPIRGERGEELLALWEGGMAYRIDPATLQTLGPKLWRDDLRAVAFSAHPRVDPDGTIWNFGLSMSAGMMVLYEIGADGRLRRAETLKIPHVPMMHDFAVTHRHLVFLLPPLAFDLERRRSGASILDSHVWRPELGMRVLIVEKADWSRRQWLQLPAGFLFHLGNAWEDAQGVIRLDYVHSDEPDRLFEGAREIMRGSHVRGRNHHIALVRLNTAKGTASQELLDIDAEFPRIDTRLTGQRYAHVIHATETSDTRAGFSAVARTHVETGKSELYSYGTDHIVEEHVFVPEPSSAPGGRGWIVGTALDLRNRCTKLSCFAADRLSAGPVAQAALPYALPLGLHGVFVKA
jgi:carotenoid cleavage dioxygenase